MSKPYTLSFAGNNDTDGRTGGEQQLYAAKRHFPTVNHKNSLGAKAIIARRASMKEERVIGHPKMRRQATVDTTR